MTHNGMYYAGIGSRRTPAFVQNVMRDFAAKLESDGFWLRSGTATGADQAFESGAKQLKTIYVPWNGYEKRIMHHSVSQRAKQLAAQHHPNWDNLKESEKLLMARNCYQILGHTLNEPVKFVVCWTEDKCIHYSTRTAKTGGTGMAISLASSLNIPVFNLAIPEHYNRALEYIEDECTV